ncbi:MAG: AraC family transcriptional regulator, partial [Pseudomonadota bacterium]
GGASQTHYAVSQTWSIGDLVVSNLDCAPQVTRLRPLSQRTTDPEAIQLRVYHGGRSKGLANGEPFETRAGEVHAFDMARSFYNETEGGARFTSVFLPHSTVGFDPSSHNAHGYLAKDCAAARMIAAATMALSETPHTTLPHVKRGLNDGFINLFRALLLGEMACEDARRAVEVTRQAQMKEFIEANLANPDLTVDAICKAFAASRATIYRDFADVGGIRRYILRRRLSAAKRDLEEGPILRGRIRQVAERWGFENGSHFNRAFRDAFDMSPSDALTKVETQRTRS